MRNKIIIVFIILMSCLCWLNNSTVFASESKNDLSTALIPAGNVSMDGLVKFRFYIKNNDKIQHKYALKTDLPAEYNSNFLVNQQVTDTVLLPASSKKLVKLQIQMPDKVTNGANNFQIISNRDDGKILKQKVSAIVNKDYSMEIIHLPSSLTILSGQDCEFNVVAKNSGSKIVKQVQLKLDLPGKCLVEKIDPQKADIKPEETVSFHVKIYIPQSEPAGFKDIKVTVFNKNVSISSDLGPVQIQKNPNLVIWLIILVLLVIAGTFIYFRKYGRR